MCEMSPPDDSAHCFRPTRQLEFWLLTANDQERLAM